MPSVEGRRLAIDKIDSLLRLESLRLDVLRRVMDRKQEDIQDLMDDRCTHLKQANEQLASTLAEETRSTVQHLIKDSGIPVSLRLLITRDIPVVVACRGVADLQNVSIKSLIAKVAGSDPVVLLPHEFGIPLPGSSITVLVNTERWPNLKGEMAKLCQFPWHNLVVSGGGYNARDKRMAAMNTLVRDRGHKLASGLNRLDVYPLEESAFFETDLPIWIPLVVFEI